MNDKSLVGYFNNCNQLNERYFLNKIIMGTLAYLATLSLLGCTANRNEVARNDRDNNAVRNVDYQRGMVLRDVRPVRDNRYDNDLDNFDRNNDNQTRLEVADEAANC